jgi:hypothetical protein
MRQPNEQHMKATKIIEEQYVGNRSETDEQPCADIRQIVAAIERLNGKDRSSVMFWIDDETILSVGGGEQGGYVAFAALGGDDKLVTLIDPDKPLAAFVDLVVGGQRSTYPARQCVDKPMVVRAASYFCQFGTSDPALCWEHG